MPDMHILLDAIILLAAGVAVVALFQRLGLGAVLGYLVGGTYRAVCLWLHHGDGNDHLTW